MVQYRNKRLIEQRTRMDSVSGVGPASYATATKPTLTLANLRNIDSINDVTMETTSAVYKPKPVSVSGNVVTYLVAEGAAGADVEVIDTTDLHLVTFIARARGQ